MDVMKSEKEKKNEKYPESVVKVSAFIRPARESSPPEMVHCQDNPVRRGLATPVNIDTTPPSSSSSGSSTPTGSPCSSVTCSHHSCGSLFAKCAEHGRWPLLQTFTNRDSPLSQQTFSPGCHRSQSVVDVNPKVKKKLGGKVHLYENVERPSEDGVSCPRGGEEKPNEVKVDESKGDERATGKTKPQPLRRKSLPDGETASDRKPNRIFGRSTRKSNRERIITSNGEKDESREVKPERSKSFDERRVDKSAGDPEKCRKCLDNSEATKENRLCGIERHEADHVINCLYKSYCNQYESDCLRSVVVKLQHEAKQWEHKIDFLETEILLLHRELKKRDQENDKLQQEIHKLRSILQETSIFKQEEDLLSRLQDSHGMPGQVQHTVNIPNPNKKQGVSGESSDHGRNHDQIEIQRFDKDFRNRFRLKATEQTLRGSRLSSGFKLRICTDNLLFPVV